MLRSATHLDLADTMHVSSYRSIRSSKYYVIYQKKAKDAEIIAAKAAEEAKAAEGIQKHQRWSL